MENISMAFAGNLVLDKVNFRLRDGEIHSLVGANGAGKSTLIKILNGIHRQTAGTITIRGNPVNIRHPKDTERFGLAFVHQELNICPDMTVAENIFIGNWSTGRFGTYNRKATITKAAQLSEVMGIDIDPGIPVRNLRTAEKQIIEILKALTREAGIIVLDEPTSSLNENEKQKLFDIINKLKRNDVSIIFISHFLEDVVSLSDRVTVLKDGTVNGIFEKYGYTKEDLIHAMMGSSVRNTDFIPLPDSEDSEEILRVEGISSSRRFTNISFQAVSGDIVGVCGLLGAGKTEIARAVFGLDPIDDGNIYLYGSPVVRPTPSQMIRRGVALLTEERKTEGFVPLLSIRENETLSVIRKFRETGKINRTKQKEFTRQLSQRIMVKMTNIEQPVFSLSGGNQQKVVMAKCLSIQPKLFLLDEPTRGVDVMAKSEIYRILRGFAEKGTSVIIFSSEIEELIANCSKIIILKKGRIIDCVDSLTVSKNDLLAMIN